MPPPPQPGLILCLEAKVPLEAVAGQSHPRSVWEMWALASVCPLSILFLESYPWDLFYCQQLYLELSVLPQTSHCKSNWRRESNYTGALMRSPGDGIWAGGGTFKIAQQCVGLQEYLPHGSCPHPHNVWVWPAGAYDLVLMSYQWLSMHICDKRKPALSWLLQILSSFESHPLGFSIRCIQPENNDQPLMKHAGFPSWLSGSQGA